jgi:hypothetical protein
MQNKVASQLEILLMTLADITWTDGLMMPLGTTGAILLFVVGRMLDPTPTKYAR